MELKRVEIEDSWYKVLQPEFGKSYFASLTAHIKTRKQQGIIIYPPGSLLFNAFNSCPLHKVKVVILGQDPYHGPGEAHGLCFSVPEGIKIPPSLRNIFKELHTDLGLSIPANGNLQAWSEQGVFLLNAILTVEHKLPASHKDIGWEQFTDAVIKAISETRDHVVFILWGAFARSKKTLIDANKHLILEAPHPAAEVYAGGKAGFFGSKPFSKTNDFLKAMELSEVNWSLPS